MISWTEYWEGELKRENGNIGSVTTQSLMWFGNYGITDKINVMAMVPYMKTEASQGTLAGNGRDSGPVSRCQVQFL